MSGLILRCCRRGLLRSQIRAEFRSSNSSSCGNRQFSSGPVSFFSQKPWDGIDIFNLCSVGMYGAAIGTVYYNFFQKQTDISAELAKEIKGHDLHEQEPLVEVSDAEKMYEDHLRTLEEKYEHELKVVQTKAEENEARVKLLEMELVDEKDKHVAELKSQAEMIASKLEMEIQTLKDEISTTNEKAGSDTNLEKLRFVNDIAEIKRQVEALGLNGTDLEKGFLLRKLAMVMGVFAYERAMINGEPLEKEVRFLQGGDEFMESALVGLPKEALTGGSWTPLELQSKFLDSKPQLRELVLIPVTGAGAVSHLIARGASNLKVKEENPEEGGLESAFEAIERLIKERRFNEAADVFEEAVEGTEAQRIAAEWAKQARLRGNIEAVHDVLSAHAANLSVLA